MERFSKKRVLQYIKWKYYSQLELVDNLEKDNPNGEKYLISMKLKLSYLNEVYLDLLGLDRINIPTTYKNR
jgi:hypothetical protein